MRIRRGIIVPAILALSTVGGILGGTVAVAAVPASTSVVASVPQTWLHG